MKFIYGFTFADAKRKVKEENYEFAFFYKGIIYSVIKLTEDYAYGYKTGKKYRTENRACVNETEGGIIAAAKSDEILDKTIVQNRRLEDVWNEIIICESEREKKELSENFFRPTALLL